MLLAKLNQTFNCTCLIMLKRVAS